VRRLLEWIGEPPLEFHHGDCVGADQQATELARDLGFRIVRHPPTEKRLRAWTDYDEDFAPRYYLGRNRDIVNASHVLIAAPTRMTEEPRSGTWFTIRFAHDTETPAILVGPTGRFEVR